MDLSEKKILISGGSAGIGKALVDELIEKGARDIAVMGRTKRKMDKLEERYPSANFLKIQGDVSQLVDIKNAISAIDEEWGALDILVNNAGVVSASLLENLSDEDIISQININLTGLILLTKHALPLLKESSEGTIMNLSSGLGYIAMPFYSVYAATKSGVKHFSEAMRRELAEYPIHVMTVFPTATDTPMMETAKVDRAMDSPEEVARVSVKGLLEKEINVILGGQQRIDDIKENFEEPLKFDQKVAKLFDSLQVRAKEHRSM
ncbi:SDR family oxidoreductase [Aliifodinibius sp. S!AR15-10]|uniref:SDR family NAD(P)-dependent oxidoreductase n=1 Tax=Aliifodinibius sp. S!AR15-10 TaxID=2950437 RepID=UPI00285CBFE4|nr:SDR family oxidoreductase [Aliifodinibius sp. S!AR15-10]MDR8389719.1 SDR family oxidoreductase [Aliifodinibius sp. S!AR15-10]